MAKPKPRRPTIGRGLPPPPRLSPEEKAEEDRIRAWIGLQRIRIEAIFQRKDAEYREQKRLKALQQAEAMNDPESWS